MDLLLLWRRLGGGIAFVLGIAALIVARTGAPTWLGWLIGAGAIALAAVALVRIMPAVTVWNRGRAVEGRVTGLDERRHTGSDHRSLKTRVRFAYRVDGTEHSGKSTWGSPSRTALLAAGRPIGLHYDPRNPARVFWDEDLPIRMPPVASL